MKKTIVWFALFGIAFALVLSGCQRYNGGQTGAGRSGDEQVAAGQKEDKEAEIKAARAALSPEDQQLVDAQDCCAVMPDNRLGVMGTPLKVMINDQPVFLCCKGCQRKALADPEKTLAQVEELLARNREAKPPAPAR